MTETVLHTPRPTPPRERPAAPAARPDPAWTGPALLLLLAGTGVLYLWNLSASGYANSFYAAAVQAGTQSWKAMLFGSLDAGNVITVDKPAAFLWPMEIAGRIFGFSSWSMLAPQALMGVASVALVCGAVRRPTGAAWGLLAGAIVALTPVAALMFRFNNPDAMLVLLLTGALYATVRALEPGSRAARWLVLAGFLVGLGFITKMGQALLVVPAIGLTYLLFAHASLGRRIAHLLAGGVATVVGAGWWIAIVELWPASSRPYIGGSTNNSILELALGYNGLGRLVGGSGNGGGGGGPGGGQNTQFGGAPGLTRLFTGDMATEISWLLPAALIGLVAGLHLTAGRRRTDLRRAGLVLFGTTLLTTGLVFSYMQGTIHPYYLVALAPSIGALIALAGAEIRAQRHTWAARVAAVLMVEATAVWSWHLLAGYAGFLPWLKVLIVAAAAVAAVVIMFGPWLGRFATMGLVAALIAGLGGMAASGVATARVPHTGSLPSAGPASSGQPGFGAGPGGTDSTGSELTALLARTTTTWAAAADGAMSAGPLQLDSGRPVISIGGFNGGDAAPTLAQFKAWVAAGRIAYYVAGGQGGPGGGMGARGTGSEIAAWVQANFTATTVGGSTVYDLRTGATS